jgi:hypothetical protein
VRAVEYFWNYAVVADFFGKDFFGRKLFSGRIVLYYTILQRMYVVFFLKGAYAFAPG